MSDLLIYGNFSSRRACDSTGAPIEFPEWAVDQQITMAFRWIDVRGGSVREIFPAIRSLSATIGRIDQRPHGGSISWQIGEGDPSADNTTELMDWQAPPVLVAEKLNAIAEEGVIFAVDYQSGSYIVRRTDGAEFVILPGVNKLAPLSFMRIRSGTDVTGFFVEVRYVQAPLAFTDDASPVLPPVPTVVTTSNGGESAGVKWNEIQRLTIPRTFRSQYLLKYGLLRTDLFSVADGAPQVQEALRKLLVPYEGSCVVTNPDNDVLDIEFTEGLAGIDVAELTVEVPADSGPPGDWTITLNLNTSEAWAALRELPTVEDVPFEIELEIATDPDDPESPSRRVKVFSENITLKRPLKWEGLATAKPVGWLRKPQPKTYLPFNQSQIGAGQASYESDILGDGEETEFEIDHNLGVAALTGIRVLNVLTGRLLRDDEYEAYSSNEGNTLTLTFLEAPAVDSLRVVLSAPEPLDFFINDLEIAIEQVTGLTTILDGLNSRLGAVESKFAQVGVPADSASVSGLRIEIPDPAEVLFYKGATPAFDDGALDTSLLSASRLPLLLPAVHDATTEELPDPLPTATGNAGKVYESDRTVIIPGGYLIRSGTVNDGDFVACDGRLNYPATRDGETDSYYPRAFERDIFAAAISEKMLSARRTLELLFGLQLQLVHANCKAQWVLTIQHGQIVQEQTDPSTLGLNFEKVEWEAPIFEEPIRITELKQTHYFGVRIHRGVSAWSLDQILYGNTANNDAAAPETANFAIRARLDRFDTENVPAPRGWLTWRVVGTPTETTDGGTSEEPAYLRIY